jgi:hypothetical protein
MNFEHIPGHKIEARDDCHQPIDQLVLVIALDILLNCALEVQEVVDKAHEALMAYNIDIPLLEVL